MLLVRCVKDLQAGLNVDAAPCWTQAELQRSAEDLCKEKKRKEKNEFRLWWSLVLCFVSFKDKS